VTTDQVAAALIAWVDATLPAIAGFYAYPPAAKTQPLPDVSADIEEFEIVDSGDAQAMFPLVGGLQQVVVVRVWRASLMFMVAADPPDLATATLRGFADGLATSALNDMTLGGRVPSVNHRLRFDFVPAFLEFDDGTQGRAMTATVAVAEPRNE